jgi:hypothetical protein
VSDLANRITELERSNDELRAALLLAGKEIRELNLGKQDSPVLKVLRRTFAASASPSPEDVSLGSSGSAVSQAWASCARVRNPSRKQLRPSGWVDAAALVRPNVAMERDAPGADAGRIRRPKKSSQCV